MTTLRSSKAIPPSQIYSKPREDKRVIQQEIQSQINAFQSSGGRIEKLGNTPLRKFV